MNYPLSEKDIESIGMFLKLAVQENYEWTITVTHPIQSKFDFEIDFLKRCFPNNFYYRINILYTNDEFAKVSFQTPPDLFLSEIRRNNKQSKRLKRKDYIVAIIGAAIGGIVGSLLTYWLSR